MILFIRLVLLIVMGWCLSPQHYGVHSCKEQWVGYIALILFLIFFSK